VVVVVVVGAWSCCCVRSWLGLCYFASGECCCCCCCWGCGCCWRYGGFRGSPLPPERIGSEPGQIRSPAAAAVSSSLPLQLMLRLIFLTKLELVLGSRAAPVGQTWPAGPPMQPGCGELSPAGYGDRRKTPVAVDFCIWHAGRWPWCSPKVCSSCPTT